MKKRIEQIMHDHYPAICIAVMLIAGFIIMVACAGCFTAANALTERFDPETGKRIARSRVNVVGTGDKASQVAAEGMYADGEQDDLGAGVRKATASQESSGMGEVARVLASGLVAATTGREIAPSPNAQPAGGGGDTDYLFAGSTTGQNPTQTQAGFTAQPGEGGVGVYGTPDCGYCRAYLQTHGGEMIDYWQHRQTALAALKERGYSGTVQFPLEITVDSYRMRVQ